MGLWQKIKTAVKNFFTGGGTQRATPPRPIQNPTSRQVVSSNTPSSRWGASRGTTNSGTTRRNILDLFRRDDEEKEKQRNAKIYGDAYKASKAEYKSLAQSIDEKSKTATPDPKDAAREKSRERLKSLVDAAGERKSLHKQNLDKLKTKREEKHEAYHAATNHRYDVGEKGVSDEERERRKQNIRTATLGEMMWGRDDEAEDVMKARMKYDKIRTSAERGAANTATLGLVNLGQKRLAKGNLKKAEDIYQKNKSKGAEIAGSLAGGLAVYGGTAGGFNDIGAKAVGRAASTEIGKKVGAKKLAELMAGNGAKAALARSLVGDTIQDSTIGAIDTAMDIAARDDLETAGDYAKAFAKGQAANYGMGLAGNLVGQALPVAGKAVRNAWDDFADESRKLRVVPKGVAESGDVIPTGEKARAGERTEFKRGNEETAKEQARNRRGAKRTAQATQESFDNDFAAFERKISDNQQKIDELKGRRKVAASPEEKAAIEQQIKELKDEVKTAHRQASLRYHPDAGGSDEWMGRFNNAFDDFKKGSYSSPSFSSATSSTRAKASADAGGDGGKTPPPRKGASAGGFKKPRGRATSSRVVDDLGVVVGKKRQKATMRENITAFTKTIRTKVADSLAAFEDEARLKAKTDHQGMLDDYGAIDKTRRYRSIANKSIGEKQVKWSGDEFENGKSLKDIYGGMDETTENEFEQYLLLRHAPDRIREGKPIFDLEHTNGKNYGDPNVCAEEANKLLEKHPEFAERAEDLYRYIRNELQNRVDAGLLPRETAEEWAKKYPNYVPTGRVGTFTDEHDIWDLAGQLGKRGNTVGAGGIKSASGSDLDIRSIKEQLADATSRNWRDMTMNNLFTRQFGDKLKNAVALYDGDVEKALLDNTINLSKAKDGGKYFAEVYENGVPKRIEIEKRFYDAMEDLYKNGRFGNGLDVMTDAAAIVAHPFKQLVTSWNPIFMVKNGLRDFSEALINTRQTKEFLQSMPAAMRELTSDGEYLKAFRNSGVSQANLVNLEEALVKNEGFFRKAANRFATLQEMVETFPRLTEYMATLKKAGIDINDPDALKAASMTLRDRAAVNAADVTVNFGRSGSVGKMLNRGIVPFFNPSVQGWSKFIRNFSEQAGTKSLLGMLAKATALGAGVTALNNLMWGDNEHYQQISARDKATNYIIPVPIKKDENGKLSSVSVDDANVFIKIPKSRFASAYSLPMVNVNNENKMGWAEMFAVGKDQIAPVDPLDSHLFAPFLLAAANKTWYGTPIESDYERENLNPSERYDENTSYIGRALGKATENLPKELQISPKKADYVADAVSGVVGDFFLPALTPSKQGDGNAFNKYVGAPMGNVLKKSFTIDATTQNNLSSRFYDELGNAKMNANSAKGGEAEKADYDRMTAYSTQISAVNKAIKAIQGSDSDTKQKDAYELRKVKNQLMQDALNGNDVPSSSKTMDAVQKYVGTTYAVENFGSSDDKEAMKVYGASKYGNLSESEMKKRIDSDKEFYNGVRAIGGLEDKMSASGVNSSSALLKAVALASANASDDLFSAYDTTEKNRTETASKMERAKAYFGNGGSEDEFVKLEKVRTSAGKLSDDDKDSELDDLDGKLARGEISDEEYRQRQDEINYNANISYLGLATSLAQANAPARGYALYDIKESNVRKGINLAAMGYSARDVRDMKKAADTDGNGYMKKQELIDFVANSGAEDKATLFDALYSYQGRNPFGTVTNYSRALAAEAGRASGVESVDSDETNFTLNADSASKSGGYYGGRRRGGRRRSYSRRSSSGKKASTPELKIDAKAYKAEKQTYKSLAETLPKSGSSKRAVMDYTPTKSNTAAAYKTKAVAKTATTKAKPPTVKFKKYEV